MPNEKCPPRIITLLTDFGLQDGFVGVMKGVIAGIAPEARVVDISHDIPPQNIRSAAFLLGASYRFFPRQSIHVVVVDPGVGSDRRGLLVCSKEHYFIGPDNGVLSPILEGALVLSIENPHYRLKWVSATFHGRDIFAPAAAHLAQGCDLDGFGPEISDPIRIVFPEPAATEKGFEGEIVYIDRFGNLVTNLTTSHIFPAMETSQGVAVLEDGSEWPLRRTYSEVAAGKPCAVQGGYDRLELSISMGSAADKSGAAIGSRVWLRVRS